jgi:hypothetical protein
MTYSTATVTSGSTTIHATSTYISNMTAFSLLNARRANCQKLHSLFTITQLFAQARPIAAADRRNTHQADCQRQLDPVTLSGLTSDMPVRAASQVIAAGV